MLALGAAKLEKAGLAARVPLVEGDVQSLRFEDGRFDAVTMAFGIRNVPDPMRTLREMFQVLASGGRLASWSSASPMAAVSKSPGRAFSPSSWSSDR